jgi:uncharacterized FAD-dependent dehydrogenase
MDFEVIIVGAGPAGIFAALTLADLGIDSVLLLEQGAGAYSDGMLVLSPEVGGSLGDFLDREDLYQLLRRADEIFVAHGAPDRVFGETSPKVEELADRARLAGLELIPTRLRHVGTENCVPVLDRLQHSLLRRVEMRTNCRVQSLVVEDGRICGVKLGDGNVITGRFVVVAPGRSGASWMKGQAKLLGLGTKASPVDIGVRVEVRAAILKEITDAMHESKLIHYSKSFDDKVRTFCMNPYGEVVTEKNEGIITVNGHSHAKKASENTNFAILVSSAFTEPFNDPIAYGCYIARLANLLGGGAIIQRLGDLLAGRRSTRGRIDQGLIRPTLPDATPGDLSFVFPYRHLMSIIEMLEALEQLAPGIYSRHTLLYGVEVKFYSNRIELSRELETNVANLFAIGDGAGITRGLLQASASGIIAGQAIAARLG